MIIRILHQATWVKGVSDPHGQPGLPRVCHCPRPPQVSVQTQPKQRGPHGGASDAPCQEHKTHLSSRGQEGCQGATCTYQRKGRGRITRPTGQVYALFKRESCALGACKMLGTGGTGAHSGLLWLGETAVWQGWPNIRWSSTRAAHRTSPRAPAPCSGSARHSSAERAEGSGGGPKGREGQEGVAAATLGAGRYGAASRHVHTNQVHT